MNDGKLIKNVPKYYQKSQLIKSLFTAYETEIDRLENTLQGVASERFIDTADFTLKNWEREFAVKSVANEPKEHRRSKIVSKLRGQGTVTKEIIKSVSESYANGEVEIQEYPQENKFTVKFIGIKGIPPNLDDLKKAIEDCKPAHLAFDFKYTYNTWNMIEARGLTWQQASRSTWEQIMVI